MKMQKIYKWSAFAAVISFGLYSCSIDEEQVMTVQDEVSELTIERAFAKWDKLDEEAGFPLNSRRKTEYNYFEETDNQLWFVPGDGYVGGPAPGFYPGVGTGKATKMGNISSFINQFATFQNNALVTVGAPVSMFFTNELTALGISNISDNVSSLSADGKGNAIFYQNISNTVTPVSETLSTFLAEVKVIGGTGKFKGAKGTGVVRGNFDPTSGAGSSVTLIDLKLKDKDDDDDEDDDDDDDKKGKGKKGKR